MEPAQIGRRWMTRKGKRQALIFWGLAVLLTVLLATSLSQMVFQPGLPLPAVEGGALLVPDSPTAAPVSFPINSFLLSLVGIALSAYVLAMLVKWVLGRPWKLLLRDSLRFVLVLLGGSAVLVLAYTLIPSFPGKTTGLPSLQPAPPPVTSPLGSPPPILIWLVGIGLAGLAVFLLSWWINARRQPSQVNQLAIELEKARQNLLSGAAWNEVIVRCYQQMSRVLQQEGGIERQLCFTPAEFEQELCRLGFPRDPVHQLTRLFELARYGNQPLAAADEQQALDSLQAILHYLGAQKGSGSVS